MKVEITPSPTAEEVAAIVAAIEQSCREVLHLFSGMLSPAVASLARRMAAGAQARNGSRGAQAAGLPVPAARRKHLLAERAARWRGRRWMSSLRNRKVAELFQVRCRVCRT